MGIREKRNGKRNKEKRARRGLVCVLRKYINASVDVVDEVRLPRLPPRQTNVDRLTHRSFYSWPLRQNTWQSGGLTVCTYEARLPR